jgi:hypothetical protein
MSPTRSRSMATFTPSACVKVAVLQSGGGA